MVTSSLKQAVKTQPDSMFFPILVYLLASCFYLYEYILQVSPGVMTTDLMRDFSVDASGLGIMAAFYFYAYTSMQIPAGLLYDLFSTKKVMASAITFCALGAIFFSYASSLGLASLGRFLMGTGSAFSFIGIMVLVSRWFGVQYFAMLGGFAQLMASLGAIFGQAPLAWLISHLGWRTSIFLLGLVGIILALAVIMLIRDYPDSSAMMHNQDKNVLKKARILSKNPQTWFAGLYTFSAWGPMAVLAALWGIPYLEVYYSITPGAAGFAISWVWIGVAIGTPTIGWFTDFIQQRRLPMTISALIGLASSSIVIGISTLPFWLMCVCLCLMGFASGAYIVSFAVVREINSPENVGAAIGINNMATLLGGALFQPLVGVILQYTWSGEIHHGVVFYSLSSYQHGLFVIPLCYFLAFLTSQFLIRETYYQGVTQ